MDVSKKEEGFPRVFQIGHVTKKVKNNATEEEIDVLAIDDQLALRGIKEGFITPQALEASRIAFQSLAGMAVGVTNAQSEIAFTPFSGDKRRLFKPRINLGAGWKALIVDDEINREGFIVLWSCLSGRSWAVIQGI